MLMLHSILWKPFLLTLSFLYSFGMLMFVAKRRFTSKKYISLNRLRYKS